MKVEDLLRDISDQLSNFSDSPRLDAEIIISYVLEIPRLKIITGSKTEISTNKVNKIQKLVERRVQGEPVAYLVGKKEFFGIGFKVNSSVLVPRPETELLVERAIEISEDLDRSVKVLDLGTGSGCISVALAVELRKQQVDFSITAVDVSKEALEVARNNALVNQVEIEFIESNWFSSITGSFDLIVSNPPYIAIGDTRVSRETQSEPKNALYSGEKGLDDVFKIIDEASEYLDIKGSLLIEIGSDQTEGIESYINSKGLYTLKVHKDLAGLNRFVELSID